MAPEILDESISKNSFEAFKKTDVYSMALVMWEVTACVSTPRKLINSCTLIM